MGERKQLALMDFQFFAGDDSAKVQTIGSLLSGGVA